MLAHCCSGTAASKEEKATDDEKAEEKKLLTTLLPIILPFVEDEHTLQLEVLFALQALCEDTGHKSGACRRRLVQGPARPSSHAGAPFAGMFLRVAQVLYNDADVCEEDAFFAWQDDTAEEVSSKTDQARVKSAPPAAADNCASAAQNEAGKMKCLMSANKFLQWLKEAQEEEGDEDEEEES